MLGRCFPSPPNQPPTHGTVGAPLGTSGCVWAERLPQCEARGVSVRFLTRLRPERPCCAKGYQYDSIRLLSHSEMPYTAMSHRSPAFGLCVDRWKVAHKKCAFVGHSGTSVGCRMWGSFVAGPKYMIPPRFARELALAARTWTLPRFPDDGFGCQQQPRQGRRPWCSRRAAGALFPAALPAAHAQIYYTEQMPPFICGPPPSRTGRLAHAQGH